MNQFLFKLKYKNRMFLNKKRVKKGKVNHIYKRNPPKNKVQ